MDEIEKKYRLPILDSGHYKDQYVDMVSAARNLQIIICIPYFIQYTYLKRNNNSNYKIGTETCMSKEEIDNSWYVGFYKRINNDDGYMLMH